MRAALQYASWAVGIPLELLIIAAFLRGLYRQFPFVFLYTIALFLSTVVEIPNAAYLTGIHFSHSRAFYYWLDEGILDVLVYVLVMSLVYRATAGLQSRTLVRAGLATGAAVVGAGSFLVHYDPHVVLGMWMTLWSRDLNFISALADLTLWMILLTARKKDPRLLLLSGGLGIQFTGEAVGQSLRTLLPWSLSPGDVIITLANLASLYIWWQALRTQPVANRASVEAEGSQK